MGTPIWKVPVMANASVRASGHRALPTVLQGALTAGSTSRLNASLVCQTALLVASYGASCCAPPAQDFRGQVVTMPLNGVLNLSPKRSKSGVALSRGVSRLFSFLLIIQADCCSRCDALTKPSVLKQ